MKTTIGPSFHYQHIQEASKKLIQRLHKVLAASKLDQKSNFSADLDKISQTQDEPTTLAFVGQYNAGKSTLIKGLTQNANITIDGDVCTEAVTEYDWGGLRIIDTPGIHAGFPTHDDLTEQQVSRSHLLIFVITGELFGEPMARYFRDLSFEKGFGPKIMLVVNKMDSDSGSAEDKRHDIELVTHPFRLEDFRTVFVSGETYLDALGEKNSSAQTALIDKSGMPELMAGLDNFAKECGLLGSLSAPLFEVKSIATQAAGICSTDRPEERAALELLSRRSHILRDSRARLSNHVKDLLNAALADLSLIGDGAAGEITPSNKEVVIQDAMTQAESTARERVEKLKTDITAAIGAEQVTLQNDLSRLAQGDLASMLRTENEIVAGFGAEVEFKGVSTSSKDPSVAENIRRASTIANGIGEWMVRVSTGSKGISGWGKMAAVGSDAHKAIYNTGKFFGYAFKPWEAAGYASKLAKIGKVLGPIAAILQVVGQIIEEKMEDDERVKFQSARTETRAIFRDGATAVRQEFLSQFEAFLNDFYGGMQKETDVLSAEITGDRNQRSGESSDFNKIAGEAASLIEELEESLA